MVTAAAFIFVLGILIFIHELGHFLVAKKAGIRVDKFSLGFPPNLFSKKVGDTTYCIGVIPLGGYVKMAGDNPMEETSGAPDEFMAKPIGHRAAVIFAGPFMNYLLAMALLFGLYFFAGGEVLKDPDRILVGEVRAGAPADSAGLKPDDHIVALNGEPFTDMDSLRLRINAMPEQPIELTWIHQGDTITRRVITLAESVHNAEGGLDTVGLIGFTEKSLGRRPYGFGEAAVQAFLATHILVAETFRFVKMFATGQISMRAVGGPIFIATQSGEQARRGAYALFMFMALLSVNLAVLNVLPVPILDGGHLIFLLVERLRGAPLSLKTRAWAQQIGLMMILGLILLVTYNDILRVVRGY